MARARKIDAQSAVLAAQNAFWQFGFQGLGTRQLEAETGITRFTLQTTYGGKMALFECALDAYLDNMESWLAAAFQDGTLDGLARWFTSRCDPAQNPPEGNWGCLMIASIHEFGDTSAEVSARAARFEHLLRTGLVGVLRQIKAKGEVAEDFDADAAAELLMAASIGLNTKIRADGASIAGAPMADGIASMIRSWARP